MLSPVRDDGPPKVGGAVGGYAGPPVPAGSNPIGPRLRRLSLARESMTIEPPPLVVGGSAANIACDKGQGRLQA